MDYSGKCKQKISNTQNCKRASYKNSLCIIHSDIKDKPYKLFRKTIRDDIYEGNYDFSYMKCFEEFGLEDITILKNANFIFKKAHFASSFNIKNMDIHASFDFTGATFESGIFITLSNIFNEIIIKDAKIERTLNLSLSNFENLTLENTIIEGNFNMTNSDLKNETIFINLSFKNEASFLNSRFKKNVTFKNIVFENTADFTNTEFYKKPMFENVVFKKDVKPKDFINKL